MVPILPAFGAYPSIAARREETRVSLIHRAAHAPVVHRKECDRRARTTARSGRVTMFRRDARIADLHPESAATASPSCGLSHLAFRLKLLSSPSAHKQFNACSTE